MSITTILDNSHQTTLINLYSKDNPILEIGDETYFIFFNSIDYHVPLIGKGIVMHDRFNDTINKHYFISVNKFVNPKNIYDEYIEDKQMLLYQFFSETLTVSTKGKIMRYCEKMDETFFDENLFKIECFFVRKTYEAIKQLQKDFLEIIQNDTEKILKEVKEIQNFI